MNYGIRLVGQRILLGVDADVAPLEHLVVLLLLSQLNAGLGSASSQVLQFTDVVRARSQALLERTNRLVLLTSKSLPLFLKLLSLLPCSSILRQCGFGITKKKKLISFV